MKTYIPLHVHSHYSLLDGLSKPDQIADRCAEIGVDTCAITDHGTISGTVKFHSIMKKIFSSSISIGKKLSRMENPNKNSF